MALGLALDVDPVQVQVAQVLAFVVRDLALDPKEAAMILVGCAHRGFELGLIEVQFGCEDLRRDAEVGHFQGIDEDGFRGSADRQHLPAFGQVSSGQLKLILSGPGASGSRPMPDGHSQQPGGWNRVILEVKDLPACISELKEQGVRFRNDMEVGPGGKQVQVEDPDGNPVELFEPAG